MGRLSQNTREQSPANYLDIISLHLHNNYVSR